MDGCTRFKCRWLFLILAALAVMTLGSGAAFAQQASITLTNCGAAYCYTHDNKWDLTKEVTGNTVTAGIGTVTWTITATKDGSAAATFTVHGGMTVTNTGTAPATIGNIVVNLQKPNSAKIGGKNVPWVSIAADVANAVDGDAATTANIVAAGSAESQLFNGTFGAGNYTVSNAKGTFVETAGSGPLNFKDASDNSLFLLVPQPVIPVGGSVTLLYDASFSTAVLPAAGTPLRVEALVTFGNAGARGGSGASASNIDINGDGVIDTTTLIQTGEQGANDGDEAKVRTVPCRVTLAALPVAPEETNSSVTITDPGVTSTGTATTANSVGYDQFPATTSTTQSWTVSVDVDGGANGGKVCNDASLDGTASGGTLNVVVDHDGLGNPIYATYACADAANDEASACADVGSQGIKVGDFCTITQGGWGAPPNGNNPGAILANNFSTVYSGGFVEVGIPGASGFSIKLNGAGAVCKYLPAGGTPGALTGDIVSSLTCGTGPSSPTTSSRVFGGQVLALELNVDFNNANIIVGTGGSISGLKLCDLTTSTSDALDGTALTAPQVGALNGQTITQVLVEANTVLGGGTGSYGLTVSQLNDLADKLNNAFDGCTALTAFAAAHLCQ